MIGDSVDWIIPPFHTKLFEHKPIFMFLNGDVYCLEFIVVAMLPSGKLT